jgi:hypothetical protein
MITKADHEKLQTEATELKAQLEVLRSIDVDAIKADYDKQIADLKAEVELLKTEDAIKATDAYKAIVAESETDKQTISSLQEQMKSLEVNKEENSKLVNTLVCEKLASVGVAPIKAQTETQETKKKVVFPNAGEYFASIK